MDEPKDRFPKVTPATLAAGVTFETLQDIRTRMAFPFAYTIVDHAVAQS